MKTIQMHFSSYFVVQRWIISLLRKDLRDMGEAKMLAGIIALAIFDYIASPGGAEGQSAEKFFNSRIFWDYCNIIDLDGELLTDAMGRMEYDEKENIICL